MMASCVVIWCVFCAILAGYTSDGHIAKDISLREAEERASKAELFILVSCDRLEAVGCVEALEELDVVEEADPPLAECEVAVSTDKDATQKYGVTNFPSIIFFRHGTPIIYDGEMDADDLLFWLEHNKALLVNTLTDDTFEHDTQATSGATTGTWYIMFYDDSRCNRFLSTWETVGSQLRTDSVVMGRIDLDSNPITKNRFKFNDCETFAVFYQGKMHVYKGAHNLRNIVNFGKQYRQTAPSDIPLEPSFFDGIPKSITSTLTSKPVMIVVLVAVLLTVVVVMTKRKRPVKFD